jgi:hypothetical protein
MPSSARLISDFRMFRAPVAALLVLCVSPLFAADTKAAKSTARAKKPEVAAAGPRDYTSKNFLLHTDLSPDESKELLGRLETMLALVSRYWGKPNTQTIEIYVVKRFDDWPAAAFPAPARDSLSSGGGITMSQTLAAVNSFTGKKAAHLGTKSVVYAVADRGTPQHESVHAYCAQMFGTNGPVWFSEGIAELGNYWRDKDLSVQIHPEVLKYLQSSDPEPLASIVDPRQRTGDSWQNYAWRWALCHLLAFNPNYKDRFRPLGLALLTEQNTSFQDVYGPVAPEISFEYLFFLKHIDQGFRVDLCSWDWKTKAVGVRGNAIVQSKIEAARGWQPSRLLVKEGQSYEITAMGEWSLAKDGPKLTAAGADKGRGTLVGVLFHDYELSEPFDLGNTTRWTAPQDGTLFLRCQDDWNSIADNAGSLTVKIKAAD